MSDASVTMTSRYRRIPPAHVRPHDRRLQKTVEEAQLALATAVRSLLRPGHTLLDVGCGTGRFARLLRELAGPTVDITLLSDAPETFENTGDVAARCIAGRLESLPFGNGSFDMVTCVWALETVPRVTGAISELLRVTKPGGHVCLAFRAQAPHPGLAGRFMQAATGMRRRAAIINPGDIEFALEKAPAGRIVRLPCAGPAVAMLVTRSGCRTGH